MADLKTRPNAGSVDAFLAGIADERRRTDSLAIVELMRQVTRQEPKMWGNSMVGFGEYHYRYASGHEGDMFLIGFSPRKDALTIYVRGGLDNYADLLGRLGRHKTGKGCLYIPRLADVHQATLGELIERSYQMPESQPGAG